MGVSNELGDREKYRQKRRRPKPQREAAEDAISKAVHESYDLIPEIGEGYRWYDLPYRALHWLGTGWRRRITPEPLKSWIWSGVNYLIPFNEHDRNWAWSLDDPLHNVYVPKDETVRVAGMWAVELFAPAELPAFEKALKRNGWLHRQRRAPHDDDNSTMLERSRAGSGSSWWKLVDVVGRSSKWFVPDGIRSDLPSEFEVIELRAIQVGAGLTAVVAEFVLSDSAATSLDEEWHRDHEPLLLRGKGRPRTLNRQFSTYWQTQAARRRLHDTARSWLGESLPGFFASNGSPQLLLDLLLFDKLDPTREPYEEGSREEEIKKQNALRALALDEHDFRHIVSEYLPKLVLSMPNGHRYEPIGDAPTLTLWGARDAIVKAIGNDQIRFYGGTDRTIAHRVEYMHNMLVMVAVSQFLNVSERKYAAIRDRASIRHGKFKPKALLELRKSFLSLSLNLASVHRDATAFWGSSVWRWDGGAEFIYKASPWMKARDEAVGRTPEESRSFNEEVREWHKKRFAELATADRDYREILSTIASLGASADAFKIGRWALFVAVVSLVVAVGTIVLADVGCNSVLHQLIGWPPAAQCSAKP